MLAVWDFRSYPFAASLGTATAFISSPAPRIYRATVSAVITDEGGGVT